MSNTVSKEVRAERIKVAKEQKQVGQQRIKLEREIAADDAKLQKKRSQLMQLKRAAGVAVDKGRLNWLAILSELSSPFMAAELRERVFVKTGREKQASQIYAAINRWLKAGMVKRSKESKGAYELTPKGVKQISKNGSKSAEAAEAEAA
jgi:hypothetical protein